METTTKKVKAKDFWSETAKVARAFEAGTDEVSMFLKGLAESKSEPVREV